MITPSKPENEKERIAKLKDYSILETPPEKDFDNITSIASYICDTPISLVTFIEEEKQWFKSNHGMEGTSGTERNVAFCAHAINVPNEVLCVEDARKDVRFKDNPSVLGDPNVIFYAGVPLVTGDGFALGTLCVIDSKPKKLDEKQLEALKGLAKQVMNLLDMRKANLELRKLNDDLKHLVDSVEDEIERIMNENTEKLKKNIQDLLAFSR